MKSAVAIRIFFTAVCLLPFVYLTVWIAIGEATPESIAHPDLRRFYEEGHDESGWAYIWTIRLVEFSLLGLAFRRYLVKVRSVRVSVVSGLLLATTTAGYFYAITRYQTAETRLAFHPYFPDIFPTIYPETVSLWWLPFLAIIAAIVGLAPFFENLDDHAR